MNFRIRFDSSGNPIEPTFVLLTKSGEMIGKLNPYNINLIGRMNDKDEVNFNVSKFNEQYWDRITNCKLIAAKEWENRLFEISVEKHDSGELYRNISGVSLGEAELAQIYLYNIEINTEEDISRDDYVPSVLYNSENKKASILHRLLEKAPHYTIRHVDSSISNIQRAFQFDGKDICSALYEISEEISCLFIIDCYLTDENKIIREISVFDLNDYCLECGNRDQFNGKCPKCESTNYKKGYGKDTSIFVSSDNLAEEIVLAEDIDSSKNCFRLVAGDELMTATIANYNPSGEPYLWSISDRSKNDMSFELRQKLDEYEDRYNYYYNDYSADLNDELVHNYNSLVDKYSAFSDDLTKIEPGNRIGYSSIIKTYYDVIDFYGLLNNSLMPTVEISEINSKSETSKLTTSSLSGVAVKDLSTCTVSAATNAVISLAKTIVNKNFKITANDAHYSNNVWSGKIKVENFSDAEDVSETDVLIVPISDDYEKYVKLKIDLVLNQEDALSTDVLSLFKLDDGNFKNELKKYSLACLNTFYDCCQKCLDVLVGQGVADKSGLHSSSIYDSIYIPYFNKLGYIQYEIAVRESEIEVLAGSYDRDGDIKESGIQTELASIKDSINLELDFETFLGRDLWIELCAYRREAEYKDDNCISDGLTNSELLLKAEEFYGEAEKELLKSSNSRLTIQTTLKNLLVMPEFSSILDNFENGNWIRVKTDNELCKLRLIEYGIDFDNLENINVEFSDISKVKDSIYEMHDVVSQAASMAGNFKSISSAAASAKIGSDTVSLWEEKGIPVDRIKLASNSDVSNYEINNRGFLFREYLPEVDRFDDKQLKIVNRGVYLTDDSWKSAKSGIGDFIYHNPETGEDEQRYGVIADVLLADFILTNKLGIYNRDGTVRLDDHSLAFLKDGAGRILIDNRYGIIAGTEDVFSVDGRNIVNNFADENGMVILDKNGMPINSNFYLDINDGSAYFRGTVFALSGFIGGMEINDGFLRSGAGENYVSINGSPDSQYVLWAGDESPENAKFSLSKTGFIKSISGQIGGMLIGESSISYNGSTWESPNEHGLYWGVKGIKVGKEFSLDMNGKLTATSGTFTGTVYAKSIAFGDDMGYIDGHSIEEKSIDGTKLEDKAIKSIHIMDGEITPEKIMQYSIAEEQIADQGITTRCLSPDIYEAIEWTQYAKKLLQNEESIESLTIQTLNLSNFVLFDKTIIMSEITYIGEDGISHKKNILTWE